MISIAGLLVAVGGLFAAWIQLKRGAGALEKAAEANYLSALMAMLQMEDGINDARARLVEATRHAYLKKTQDAEAYVALCIDAYLNTLDRLCSAIRYGLVEEEIYRKDYRDVLKQAIKKNLKRFGSATPFRHIEHVNKCWSDDVSARDKDLPARLLRRAS